MYFLVFVVGAFCGLLMALLFVAVLVFLYLHADKLPATPQILRSYEVIVDDLQHKSDQILRKLRRTLPDEERSI